MRQTFMKLKPKTSGRSFTKPLDYQASDEIKKSFSRRLRDAVEDDHILPSRLAKGIFTNRDGKFSGNKGKASSLSSYRNLKQNLNRDLEQSLMRNLRRKQGTSQNSGKSKAISETKLKAEEIRLLSQSLKFLQSKYSSIPFLDDSGKIIDLQRLQPYDMKFNNPTSKLIFQNLLRIKELTKKQVPRTLSLTLLGTTSTQLSDPYFITNNALDLLKFDRDPARASYLCRISDKKSAIVGMNTIMEWHFAKKDQKAGIKAFHERRSSGIPCNPYTYLELFNGVAKTTAWGLAKREICEKMIEIFKSNRSEFLDAKDNKGFATSIFNACLSILVRNFDDLQAIAWGFFDELFGSNELELEQIYPDSQTFTILLQGVKKYAEHERSQVLADENLSSAVRLAKLLEIEANHVKVATAVFDKVRQAATPPKANLDAKKNQKNIHNWYKSRIEIDFPLFTTFLNSFCSRDAGTGEDLHSGSHYVYAQRALDILRIVSPDVEKMLKYISKDGLSVEPRLKAHTDMRVNKALKHGILTSSEADSTSIDDINPSAVIKDFDLSRFNPMVHMIHRGKFNTEAEPLIDLTRSVSGKDSVESMRSINKFMLNQVFETLINLGLFKEFVRAYYYASIEWGGVKLLLPELAEQDILKNFLPNMSVREFKTGRIPSIIDEASFDSFIYKIAEHGRYKGKTSTNVVLQMLRILVTPELTVNGIEPTMDHMNKICSIMVKDLHYYNDTHVKKSYTTRYAFSYRQLTDYLRNLIEFGEIHNMYISKSAKLYTPGYYHAFMEKVTKILQSAHWIDVEDCEKRYHITKLILKANILDYRPQIAALKPETRQRTRSIEKLVGETLSAMKDAGRNFEEDKKLRSVLKSLRAAESVKGDVKSLNKRLYDLISGELKAAPGANVATKKELGEEL
ncbi:hypothetical protein LELG_02359 [Lodderomyces elongisporus NRRL YB-4239]|uniref:Mitochondrial group I intron splicing factor CCM1 n=1 Tax=Lodderomyces elongisporus (strain ATCC 11503 / CBS 2605 / JCM 1781 / NBRC 1676 / NRRL YB-4239) TaxID=379508 RepID=A5DYC2_LODEL|nr:hypothetical protein LELG_02359 [Lodderomyces elongisporus NRRL YB-4239]